VELPGFWQEGIQTYCLYKPAIMFHLDKIIIWGHTLHSHTHSYIHDGYYRMFKKLGYTVCWVDNDPSQLSYPARNALIIVHGYVSSRLPLHNSNFYVAHNMPVVAHPLRADEFIPYTQYDIDTPPANGIHLTNIMELTVSGHRKHVSDEKPVPDSDMTGEFLEGLWENTALPIPVLYQPWATDLFPSQIQYNMEHLAEIRSKQKPKVHMVGMPLGIWSDVKKYADTHGLAYSNMGGTFDASSDRNMSVHDAVEFIQQAVVAPAVQNPKQLRKGYIPCRIFKNISYGKAGVTNNPAVASLLGDHVIFHSDINTLMTRAYKFETDATTLPKVYKAMDLIKRKHTYKNRCEALVQFLTKRCAVILTCA